MNELIVQAVQALSALPARVVRGWPQAIVALPAIVIKEADNSRSADGALSQALDIMVRAVSPEAADALAAQADDALHMRRTACRDSAERDGSCFVKLLRYERRVPGEEGAPEMITLRIAGTDYPARVLERSRRRDTVDIAPLGSLHAHPVPAKRVQGTLRLSLPYSANAALASAMDAGNTVALPGGHALVAGITQRGERLEATLHDTQ